jgi:hypothetical protein
MHIFAADETWHAARAAAHTLGGCLVLVLFIAGCQKPDSAPPVATPEDSPVTKLGSLEVTARLAEIPEGAIFKRDLYNYATVLKYQVLEVHRGQVTEPEIYVAHYNPFKPRAEAADQRVSGIGGDLRTFRGGQVQRLALEASVEDHYMGGIVDKYFGQHTGPIYWAVWTNLVRD